MKKYKYLVINLTPKKGEESLAYIFDNEKEAQKKAHDLKRSGQEPKIYSLDFKHPRSIFHKRTYLKK